MMEFFKYFAAIISFIIIKGGTATSLRGDGETLELPDNTIIKKFDVSKGVSLGNMKIVEGRIFMQDNSAVAIDVMKSKVCSFMRL